MMDVDQARTILGIGESFTFHELRSRFRAASLTAHPDVGGSELEFIALMDAYKTLKPHAGIDEVAKKALTTVEGIPLSELGKGYPITVSAKMCERCQGAGYKEFHETRTVYGTCGKCGGTGLLRYPCRRCGGDGVYKNPRTKKSIGECRGCKGSGWYYPPRRVPGFLYIGVVHFIPGTTRPGRSCRLCRGVGRGLIQEEKKETLYTACTTCNGKGEVKMANPVIPRGYLT